MPDLKATTNTIQTQAAQEVVAAELAFSARAQLIDPKDAFLEFFSNDAIMFRPDPFSALDRLKNSPAWGVNLQWWPAEVGVSVDGKLAYSTGPVENRSTLASKEPDSYGTYFSIWRKSGTGKWEVIADLGTDTPTLVSPREQKVLLRLPEAGLKSAPAPSLITIDQEYATAANQGLGKALASIATAQYRLHLPVGYPLIGAQAAIPHLQSGPCSWAAKGEMVASSGDFGATYGSGDGGYIAGHFGYLRVWRRNISGQWQLMAEVINQARR